MSMPQALERSLLERKERDELAAIAEAMGVKPGSRASKATLIDTILREAGIETGAEDRPKRPRTRSTAASRNGAAAKADKAAGEDAAPGDVSADSAGGQADLFQAAPAPGTSAPAPANGEVEAKAKAPPAASEPPAGVAPATAPAATTAAATAKAATPASTTAAATAKEAAPAATTAAVPVAAGPAPTSGPPTSGPPTGGPPPGGAVTSGAEASAEAPPAGRAVTSGAEASAEAPPAGRAAQAAGAEAHLAAGPPPAPAPAPAPQQPQGREQREQSRDQQRDRGNQQRFDNQGGGEPGNRRSRRRRGRDRGGERDLQQDRSGDQQYSGELVPAEGLLDLRDEGYGFLRTGGYLAGARDAYVSLSQVRRFALRKGDYVVGASRPAATNEKYPALLRIDTVNGMTPDEARARPRFEDLTPLFPDSKLRLEVPGDTNNMISRIVDLVSPIGKGQRGLIVSPPKAGKTTVLKQIAHSIEINNPEVNLMVLLVDERPEEVTDFRRSVKAATVVASTFDRPSDEHTQVAELTIERAKRLVEMGEDVVIVLDGITRLSRAYNLAAPATGRIMSGGLDVNALYPPKKFFGAARNVEEGGSLTILATALVETGSKMDEVIFEEFKGTGNMELKLDRKLAERRIYPALDVNASSTRQEQLLFERGQIQQVFKLRRVLNALEPGAGLELLMDKIKSTKSNDEFLAEIAKAPVPSM